MIGKYKRHGWFNESERHSLAAQGISSTIKPIGYSIGQGALSMARATAQGSGMFKDEEEEEREDDDTDYAQDADDLVSGEAEEEHEEEWEPILGTEEQDHKEKVYAEKVDEELEEVEDTMEDKMVGNNWMDHIKESIAKSLEKYRESVKDKNAEGMSEHLGQIKAKQELLKDKIELLQRLKQKIKSAEYTSTATLSHQLDQLNKLNVYLEKLEGETSLMGYRSGVLSKGLTDAIEKGHLPMSPKKTDGFFKDIMPSFHDMFSFDVDESEARPQMEKGIQPQKTVQTVAKKSEGFFKDIMPSWHEMFNPETLNYAKLRSAKLHSKPIKIQKGRSYTVAPDLTTDPFDLRDTKTKTKVGYAQR